MRCLVLTASRSGGIGNGLTYESGDLDVQPGQLVNISLRGKPMEGIVISVGDPTTKEEYDVKKVTNIVSTTPLLLKHHILLLQWMAKYYWCSLRQAARVFLPPPPWRNLLPKETVRYYAASDATAEPRGPKQKEIVAEARAKGFLTENTLKYAYKVPKKTIQTLVEQGFFREERTIEEPKMLDPLPHIEEPALTPVQEKAWEEIVATKKPSLLFGITGSGKTEIYAKMIAQTVNSGGQAMLLVPEILLTEQSISRFVKLLPRERIAMLHSKLTEASRRSEWKRIHSGQVSLVIGSRSALFAPLKDLRLLIIDEEHEWTYKNEQMPRYHARETAEMLYALTEAKLVMGTATPSLEAWKRAKDGRYHLARVPERYMNRPVPTVRVIDLADVNFGNMYPFSPTLLDEMKKRLDKGEQTVLFLNRRGMATALLCLECKRRVLSPESQIPYTLHRTPDGRPFLLDHITGTSMDIPHGCPSCGSASLRAVGAGTQKLEDLLTSVFPKARLIRADSDTLKFPEHMRLLLSKMHNREADILLGTQAVVKGLDLPGVTLAAVMVADVGLSLPHFRAGERVFQLLTQLTGRSGRLIPGEVIIQTYRPDASEIVAASKHKTESYLDEELALRGSANYPPNAQMIRMIFTEDTAKADAQKLLAAIRMQQVRETLSLQASSAPTFFGAGKTWHVLVRGKDARKILPLTTNARCAVDVDPLDTL